MSSIPPTPRRLAGVLLGAALALLTACAGTGGSGGGSAGGASLESGTGLGSDTLEAITYRQLRVEDFHADKPPARLLAHASALGAVICARVRVTPDSRYHTQQVRLLDGSHVYVAVIDRLRFRAEMMRDCSWWNRRTPAHETARILAHEQLHFALFELAARHLNARVFSLVTVFRFTASSREQAERAALAYVRELEHLATEELQTRNHAYDRETAYGARHLRQQDWSDRIQRELLETARYAAVSDPPWPPLDDGPAQQQAPADTALPDGGAGP